MIITLNSVPISSYFITYFILDEQEYSTNNSKWWYNIINDKEYRMIILNEQEYTTIIF